MAIKISALTATTSLTGTEVLPLVQSGTTKKITFANLMANITSVNGLTITASTGTLTIAASKTLTLSNTLTFTGTDSSSVAFGAGGTVLYSGGALGTPSSGTLTNCSFPTLNQNTTGSAASLSVSGQTGLITFTGLASTNRIKTVRDAADTILELGGSYTPTGTWTNMILATPNLGTPSALVLTNATGLPVAGGGTGIATTTAYGIITGGTTPTGVFQNIGTGTSGQILISGGSAALPTWKSPSRGMVYMMANATATTISAATWTKASGTTTASGLAVNTTEATTNRITNTSGATQVWKVSISGAVRTSAGSILYNVGISLNGANPTFYTRDVSSTSGQDRTFALSDVYISVPNNQYVETWLYFDSGSTTITVSELVMSIAESL